MQKIAPPAEGSWYDASAGQEPEYTGKFDCKVNDDKGGVFPAQWIPHAKRTMYGERGPGWRVLLPPAEGTSRKRVVFEPLSRIKRWLPQPPRKGRKAA